MLISQPDPKTKLVDDLDFTFTNGYFMPITIDKNLGDTIEWDHDQAIVIHLTARPSAVSPTETLPAEDITIFRQNILFIQHRVREVTELTDSQKLEWEKTFQEMSTKTVQ